MDAITREQLNILIHLGKADNDFCKSERNLLRNIAERHNFPPAEVQDLVRKNPPVGSLGALSLNKRIEYMITCVEMMLVDGKIHKSEIVFCNYMAVQLGFKQSVVEYLSKSVQFTEKEELINELKLQYQLY